MNIGTTNGLTIATLPEDGPLLATEQDAIDVMGELYGSGADLVAVPVSRLGPGFWQLETRVAGHFIQKFITYGLRVAFVGDLSAELAASSALRDYVRECNRGQQVTFAADAEELARRLG
ncbi:MAG TPA: DUF4180 domain-containing protein [Devosiaceae bacterium]|jgi:hypothetical protein|nr:DUF4180 domain-containing protein [Devosiaceae bacterium]